SRPAVFHVVEVDDIGGVVFVAVVRLAVLLLSLGAVELRNGAKILHAALLDPAGVVVPGDAPAAPFLLDGADDRRIDGDFVCGDRGDDPIERQLERLPLLGAPGMARTFQDAVHGDEVDPRGVANTPDDHLIAYLHPGRIVDRATPRADRHIVVGNAIP